MVFALATFVVLLVLGRNELSIKEVLAAVGFVVLSGGVIALLKLPFTIFMTVIAIADIYLVLKIFGADIAIR